jgi:hypothetical protein
MKKLLSGIMVIMMIISPAVAQVPNTCEKHVDGSVAKCGVPATGGLYWSLASLLECPRASMAPPEGKCGFCMTMACTVEILTVEGEYSYVPTIFTGGGLNKYSGSAWVGCAGTNQTMWNESTTDPVLPPGSTGYVRFHFIIYSATCSVPGKSSVWEAYSYVRV